MKKVSEIEAPADANIVDNEELSNLGLTFKLNTSHFPFLPYTKNRALPFW